MAVVRPIDPAEWRELRTIRLAALDHDPTAFCRTRDEEVEYGSEHWQRRAVGSPDSQTFVAVEGDRFEPPSVELWVTNGNLAAIALYRSCGFVLTDVVRPSPADPCRDETRMHRA